MENEVSMNYIYDGVLVFSMTICKDCIELEEYAQDTFITKTTVNSPSDAIKWIMAKIYEYEHTDEI